MDIEFYLKNYFTKFSIENSIININTIVNIRLKTFTTLIDKVLRNLYLNDNTFIIKSILDDMETHIKNYLISSDDKLKALKLLIKELKLK